MIDTLLYRRYTNASTQNFMDMQSVDVSNYFGDDLYAMLEVRIEWYKEFYFKKDGEK
jgi:hypothetical protein